MRTRLLVTVLGCLVVACGSVAQPPDAGTLDAGATAATDAGNTYADAGTNTDAGTNADAGAALPVMTFATLLSHGSIRVQWTNPNPGCEALTLMRSKDGATPVVASQPSASSTEVVDAPGHASGTYCYALSCARGGVTQGTSNEKCASQ